MLKREAMNAIINTLNKIASTVFFGSNIPTGVTLLP